MRRPLLASWCPRKLRTLSRVERPDQPPAACRDAWSPQRLPRRGLAFRRWSARRLAACGREEPRGAATPSRGPALRRCGASGATFGEASGRAWREDSPMVNGCGMVPVGWTGRSYPASPLELTETQLQAVRDDVPGEVVVPAADLDATVTAQSRRWARTLAWRRAASCVWGKQSTGSRPLDETGVDGSPFVRRGLAQRRRTARRPGHTCVTRATRTHPRDLLPTRELDLLTRTTRDGSSRAASTVVRRAGRRGRWGG
jgi:hypothetical protein